jgi:hypothetical protein
MQTLFFVVLPLVLFTFMGMNGIAMAISPLYWASARWTAKGQFGYDHVANEVRNGKAIYWRCSGVGMAVLSGMACVLLAGWAF